MSDRALDAVTLALVQNRLDHITKQMGWVMTRTARSPIFNHAHDFSCYLTDKTGTIVAQADGIFRRRPDINCILHTHIPAATVVASLECGLLPVIQHALIVFNEIVYVDCDTGNDEDAVREVLDQLGDKKIAMIRNHGVFVLGKSVAEVLFLTITLEYACRCQLDAMQTHAKVKTFNLDSAEQLAAGFTGNPDNEFVFDGTLQWEGWLRKLDRMGSCYRE